MKRFYYILTVAGLLFFLSSCIEIEVTNRVNADGSIDRTVYVRDVDPEDFDFSELPVYVDSTWQIRYTWELEEKSSEEGESTQDTIYCMEASKHFASVEGINADYKRVENDFVLLDRRAVFSRRFQWFYTKYHFEEVIEPLFDGPSRFDYLSPEEYELWRYENDKEPVDSGRLEPYRSMSEEDYKALRHSVEEKFDRWVWDVLFNQYYSLIYRYAEREGKGWITPEMVEAKKDSLQAAMLEFDGSREIIDTVFGMEIWSAFGKEFQDSLDLLDRKAELGFNIHDYEMNIQMPGELTGSNAEEISEEGMNYWDVESEKYYADRMLMYAESRMRNEWTFWVSGIFVVFVLAGFVLRLRRKR